MNGACGVINSGQELKPYVWNIAVHPQFSLSINFLHFHLPISQFCLQTYLDIKVPGLSEDIIPKLGLKYCGHQMPWIHSFQESHATATFDTEWLLAKGYYFVMTFESFDVMLKSVGLIYRCESWYYKDLYYKRSHNWILLERNPDFNFFKTEFQILFHAIIIQQIILKYPTAPQLSRRHYYKDLPNYIYILSDVRVHDGPGILSPLVVPTCNASTEYCTCYLSSYQGLIKYRIPAPSNVWNGYIPLPNRYDEHVREQGILWENNDVLNSTIDCVHQGKDIRFHSQSGICWGQPFHSLIKIHFMVFNGWFKHILFMTEHDKGLG